MKKGTKFKRINWTSEVLTKIKEEFGPYGSAPKLAEELGISVHAIYKKAEALGLKAKPKNTYISSMGYLTHSKMVGREITLQPTHRKVMEEYIGRKLTYLDIVHHIDGDKLNNTLDNLVLTSRSEHINIHRKELLNGRDDIVRHSEESERTESLVI